MYKTICSLNAIHKCSLTVVMVVIILGVKITAKPNSKFCINCFEMQLEMIAIVFCFMVIKKDTEVAIVIRAHLFCLCIGKIIAAEGNVCD